MQLFGLVNGASHKRTAARGSTDIAEVNFCGGNRVDGMALGGRHAVIPPNMFQKARTASCQHGLEVRGCRHSGKTFDTACG
jgi:hypothetical protein